MAVRGEGTGMGCIHDIIIIAAWNLSQKVSEAMREVKDSEGASVTS